jgi:hypothetical protein
VYPPGLDMVIHIDHIQGLTAIIALILVAFFHLVGGQRSRLEKNENK